MKHLLSFLIALFFIMPISYAEGIKKTTYVNHIKEISYLAMAIHQEARGEPLSGKIAVANVIFNRMDHHEFPDTVQGVIRQKGQFQWYRNRKIRSSKPPSEEIKQLASKLYWQYLLGNRKDNTGNAIFFTSNGRKPAARAIKASRIGGHQFFTLRELKAPRRYRNRQMLT